ncbi:hypothetical protein KCP78_11195 [Salmonella enterica subsp. enterica]|nr:hypothetical protein KCP78_11195 [Salmonella enterica subsp. enterica]
MATIKSHVICKDPESSLLRIVAKNWRCYPFFWCWHFPALPQHLPLFHKRFARYRSYMHQV